MPVDSKKQILKSIKNRSFLNKDFEGLRQDLLDYSRTYFPNVNKDWTESSLGGLQLDLLAYVGDHLSFYLDHQFHELSPESSVEERNIQRHLRDAGVPIVGAAPAVVSCLFFIKVPVDSNARPDPISLPVINAGTILQSENNIFFELIEDLDFTKLDNAGNLIASLEVGDKDNNNVPLTFILSLTGICISGQRNIETFGVGTFSKFKTFTLSKENITEVISVRDDIGNIYYEVEYLTQDTVFKRITNRNQEDVELVPDIIQLIPVPYRFVSETNITTNLTTLTFGGGDATSLDNDIIPDPSEFAMPLYGKTTFSRFSLNPANLLDTQTLGVMAPNTNLTVEYRYGGGLSHNIPPKSIRGVSQLKITFPNSPNPTVASFVRASVDAVNNFEAAGGAEIPSIDELKLKIPSQRNAQSRIVSKEDLLARIYKMPSNFGRVFRASIHSNPNNPFASRLFILCKNASGQLSVSPDSLKKNLRTYLNQFRLISDAIDMLDGIVIDFQLNYSIVVEPQLNKQLVVQNVNSKLKDYFNIKKFDMDQPIVLDEVRNIIFNNHGVISVQSLRVSNISGVSGEKTYSDYNFDIDSNTTNGIIYGPNGSIFQIRFPDFDIAGTAI